MLHINENIRPRDEIIKNILLPMVAFDPHVHLPLLQIALPILDEQFFFRHQNKRLFLISLANRITIRIRLIIQHRRKN